MRWLSSLPLPQLWETFKPWNSWISLPAPCWIVQVDFSICLSEVQFTFDFNSEFQWWKKVELISFTQSCILRAQLPRPMRNKVREGSYEITGKSHPASSWWEKNPVRIKSLEGWAQRGLWGGYYVLVSYQWWVEGTALFWVLGGAASNSCSPPKFSWPPEVWKRLHSLTVGMLEWEDPWDLPGRATLKPCLMAPWKAVTPVSGAEHAVGGLLVE